ncbi:MAG: ParB/RepB/Spo0J family partition protein [Burkholderiales bacterium]|nr:ParB/RepB/Spo0J family partition protein [Burkholderiales bacterium]
MAKPKGLGRGLDVLLGGGSMDAFDAPAKAAGTGDGTRELPIDALLPGKYQPRTRMDEAALAELAESIREQGILQPILVRPVGEGRFEIIAGERRWRASRLAGLTEVPVLVRTIPDESALAMGLIENIQREDLNALEEAHGIQRLIDEFGMTHELAAKALGRSRTAVSNLLRLRALSAPVQELLYGGAIEMGHARALLALEPAMQIVLANKVAAQKLSVRETEREVARMNAPSDQVAGKPRAAAQDPDVARLQERLAQSLGTGVRLKVGPKHTGRMEISWHSLEHLDELTRRLGLPPD